MRTEPYAHQLEEYRASGDLEARALFWQMRTGKSKVVIDTAFRLRDAGELDAVLVLAPNGVHSNWARRELPRHAWDDGWSGATWRTSRTEEETAKTVARGDFPWLAVNNEVLGLDRVQAVIRSLLRRGRVMLVADECHDFRRPGARRTTLARGLAPRCTYRRILSGTPVLNSPLHAFSQFELLGRAALGFKNYGDFKARYSVPVQLRTRGGRRYEDIDGYINQDELADRIGEWASILLREDCPDLPELVETEREVPLSKVQREAYRSMLDEWMLGDLSVVEGGVRTLKLQQILGGFFIDEHGDVVSIDDSPPRLDAMLEQVVGTFPGKSIVWCRFREDIRRVCRRLDEEGVGHVEFHGGVSARGRDEAEDRLRDDPTVSVMVGQPQSGGMGRDFSEADAIVWYSHSHDAITRDQAKERATAVGGRSVSMVDLFTANSVDVDILENLADKRDVSDRLVGLDRRERLREMASLL